MAGTLKVGTITTPTGSGSITIPSGVAMTGHNSPIFMAYANGTTQSIATATFTTWTNYTVVIDTDSMFDTTNHKLTIPTGKGGTYFISVQMNMSTSADFDEFAIRIRTNDNATNFLYSSVRNENFETNHIAAVRDLSAGDNLTLDLYHNRGSAAVTDANNYKSNYSVFRIK